MLPLNAFDGCAGAELDRGEAVQVSPALPVLLRLPERPWGATATLPASVVDSIAGREAAPYQHVAIHVNDTAESI